MINFKEFIKESSTGAVGGLGFNSGTPSVNSPETANYAAVNTADSDQKNNILRSWIKTHHGRLHDRRVGFKSFDPKDAKTINKR